MTAFFFGGVLVRVNIEKEDFWNACVRLQPFSKNTRFCIDMPRLT